MDNQWITPVVILSFVMVIICIFTCKMFIKEYKDIRILLEPRRSNVVHHMPIVTGVRVDTLDDNIEIITIYE